MIFGRSLSAGLHQKAEKRVIKETRKAQSGVPQRMIHKRVPKISEEIPWYTPRLS